MEEILAPSDDLSTGNQSTSSDEEDEEQPLPKDSKVIIGALKVLANYSRYWSALVGEGEDASMDDIESSTPSQALAKQLHEFCLGESDDELQNLNAAKENQAAELAALSISRFYGHKEETAQLISKICSKKKLGSCQARGALPTLQSLEVFAKRCSHVFATSSSLISRLWTHLLDDLIGKGENPESADKSGSKARKTAKQLAVKEANIRCLAVKVAANLVVYCRSAPELVEHREKGNQLIKLLFDILRSDGKTWTSNSTLAANFRASAACGLMKIMRNRQLEASISVSEWHLLGFTMQDSSEDVRRKFLKKLTSRLTKQRAQSPHKYLSFLALAGTDSSTNVKKSARSLLKIGVERMRRMFDAASSRESEIMSSPGQIAGSPSTSALMVPEYSLPYVIHLLAHHPEFPTKLVEKTPSAMIIQSSLWSDQLVYLRFFLDGLVTASARAADNIAFLIQILTKLSQCHDVTSPDSNNMYPLIDSAVVLLKKKIKKQSDLKPFPGRIYLPKHLYSPGRPTHSTVGMIGARAEPEAPESLGSSSSTPAPRLDSSMLSPIKPTDFASHFMKLNSPPGSLQKRKRSLTAAEQPTASGDYDAARSSLVQSTLTTPPRRQSLLRKVQPEGRTFADDSSDSGAESDSFLSRGAKKSTQKAPAAATSSTTLVGTGSIAEEKEEELNGVPQKKRKTTDPGSVAAHVEAPSEVRTTPIERPRLRSGRRQLQG